MDELVDLLKAKSTLGVILIVKNDVIAVHKKIEWTVRRQPPFRDRGDVGVSVGAVGE